MKDLDLNKGDHEVKNPALAKLTQPIVELLLGRTAIYSDALRGVELVKNEGSYRYCEATPTQVDCLILGKEHYSQSTQTFPIQSLKEVRNILSLEAQASELLCLYIIGQYIEGVRTVISWKVDTQVLADLQLTPKLVVPESALLLADDNQQLITIERSDRTFWFARRQQDYICAEKKGLIGNQMMFLASAGLSDQLEHISLVEHQYLHQVFTALPKLLLTQFMGLKNKGQTLSEIDWMSHFKYSGLAASLIIAGYLGVSSLYLNLKLEWVKGQATELSAQTRDVFALQSEYNQMLESSAGFIKATSEQASSNIVWRLVAPLAQQGIKIERVGMLPDGLYIINFEANSATQVLEIINKDKAVVGAKFRGDTYEVNGKEQFAIAFKIAKQNKQSAESGQGDDQQDESTGKEV